MRSLFLLLLLASVISQKAYAQQPSLADRVQKIERDLRPDSSKLEGIPGAAACLTRLQCQEDHIKALNARLKQLEEKLAQAEKRLAEFKDIDSKIEALKTDLAQQLNKVIYSDEYYKLEAHKKGVGLNAGKSLCLDTAFLRNGLPASTASFRSCEAFDDQQFRITK